MRLNEIAPQSMGIRPIDKPTLKDAKATPMHPREDWIQDSDGTWVCDWYMEDGHDVRCRD
jgi:hypothetical protein